MKVTCIVAWSYSPYAFASPYDKSGNFDWEFELDVPVTEWHENMTFPQKQDYVWEKFKQSKEYNDSNNFKIVLFELEREK